MKAAVIKRNKQAWRSMGQTLVELIVAIFIFSIVLLGGLSFFTLGFNSFERAKRVSFAREYGYSALQRYSAISWYQLENWRLNNPGGQQIETPTDPSSGITYTCTTTITAIPAYLTPGGLPQVDDLSTVVTWPGQTAMQAVDFETWISSPVIPQVGT